MIKANLSGACIAISLIATATAFFAFVSATEITLGPLARILDSYTHVLLAVGIIFALLSAILGLRVIGLGLAIITTIASASLYVSYRNLTVPILADHDPELRILFFNALSSNKDSGEQILSTAIAAQPDIMVFAEAAALGSSIDALRRDYAFVSPCTPDACDLLIATNLGVKRFWQLQLHTAFPERYAVLEFERPNGEPAFLVANHLGKPWMSGFAETEIGRLKAQYNWLDGPVVVVGDFNMAPWSLPMRDVLDKTNMRTLRGQKATWPVWAGPLGIPIDQILTRDGPRVTKITTFGELLHSNHLGFVADIAILPTP